MSSPQPSIEASPPILASSSYTLNQIDASRRPTEEVACMNCPLAIWMATDQLVKCYCRTLYMFTWETSDPGKIRICDAPEQARLAAEAG